VQQKPPDIPPFFGRLMVHLFWIGSLVVLTYFFDDMLTEQENPNQQVTSSRTQEGRKEVVLKRNRAGHYVMNGAINQYPVTFLLDTGATDVAIPLELAISLGVKKGLKIDVSTANGVAVGYLSRAESVSLGNIVMNNVKVTIVPGMDGERVLLGMSFLRHLEMIQKGGYLTLRQ
jgi:aspartyl protease family protein